MIKSIVELISFDSMLYLAINGNIRIYGIDGCMSSFLDQTSVRSVLSFLVIGDLAFFYDMNSIRI